MSKGTPMKLHLGNCNEHPATAHALGCGMNNGRPVIACVCGLPNKSLGEMRNPEAREAGGTAISPVSEPQSVHLEEP